MVRHVHGGLWDPRGAFATAQAVWRRNRPRLGFAAQWQVSGVGLMGACIACSVSFRDHRTTRHALSVACESVVEKCMTSDAPLCAEKRAQAKVTGIVSSRVLPRFLVCLLTSGGLVTCVAKTCEPAQLHVTTLQTRSPQHSTNKLGCWSSGMLLTPTRCHDVPLEASEAPLRMLHMTRFKSAFQCLPGRPVACKHANCRHRARHLRFQGSGFQTLRVSRFARRGSAGVSPSDATPCHPPTSALSCVPCVKRRL